MARTPKSKTSSGTAIKIPKPVFERFNAWVIGNTPLICHAWSEKARLEMLDKQLGTINPQGREARDPEADFLSSLYEMGDGRHGFPVTAVKKAILTAAHKDKGIARVGVRGALYLFHEIIRVRPALAGAICDMPLIPIIAGKPEMREDMVRVGVGLNKKASLAYRAQFYPWAFNLSGRYNTAVLSVEALLYLIEEAGFSCGVGDWRTEKDGVMGAFHVASDVEAKAWERFRSGDGPLPEPTHLREAA